MTYITAYAAVNIPPNVPEPAEKQEPNESWCEDAQPQMRRFEIARQAQWTVV